MKRAAAALLLLAAVRAEAASIGTTAAPFLRIAPLARPAGMGNAFAAVGGDLGALHFNPAGLALLPDHEIAFTYSPYALGANFQYIAGAYRWSPELTFAPFVQRFSIDDVARDRSGATIAQFDNTDIAVGLSFSYAVARGLALGGAVKNIRSDLAQFHASAVAFDVGVRYEYPFFEGLALGVSATNIGGDLTFISAGDPLPMTGRLGFSYRTPSGLSLVAFDVEVDREKSAVFHVGGEFRAAAPLVLRTGFEFGGGGNRSFEEAARLGLGFESRAGNLDYAYQTFDAFGAAHRISYSYRFGEALPRAGEMVERERRSAAGQFFGRFLGRGSSSKVSVGAFRNVEDRDDLAWLERAIPATLAARLRDEGIAVAEEGSRYEVTGRFARLGPGRLWVSARLVDTRDGRLVVFRDAVVGDDEVFRAVGTLAAEIVPHIPR